MRERETARHVKVASLTKAAKREHVITLLAPVKRKLGKCRKLGERP